MSAHDKSLIPFTPAELRARHDGWTAEKQIAFIEALAETACVEEACRRVGMSDSAAYQLRRRPCGAQFRRAWDAALDYGLHRLEQAAMSRALNGVRRPIFHKGEQVGEWRAYDERLTMFLLRSRRPARYGKWIERMLAPEPDILGAVRGEEESADILDTELVEIAERAPEIDGNPVSGWPDWLSDSRARVEE
jgi:hypothetical protein